MEALSVVAKDALPAGAIIPWVTPLAMNYTTPATIFYGSYTPNDIYRSTDRRDNWENIGGSGFHDIITCPSNVNRMYAVSDNVIRRSDNILITAASVTWTTISSNIKFPILPNGVGVSRLSVNPANSNHIWFCKGGYFENIKVYRSLDAGLNWANVSAGLPNVAILCIVAQEKASRPGAVYVGTDIGVFYRDDILKVG